MKNKITRIIITILVIAVIGSVGYCLCPVSVEKQLTDVDYVGVTTITDYFDCDANTGDQDKKDYMIYYKSNQGKQILSEINSTKYHHTFANLKYNIFKSFNANDPTLTTIINGYKHSELKWTMTWFDNGYVEVSVYDSGKTKSQIVHAGYFGLKSSYKSNIRILRALSEVAPVE